MPMLYYVQELLDLFRTICGTYVCYNSERGLAFPSSACKPDKMILSLEIGYCVVLFLVWIS